MRALCENVDMIGHEAKRVKLEGMLCRAFFKDRENGLRGGSFV
jgi:hypothetical protein